MILSIAMAVVGSWTYGDFVAMPSPPKPPVAAVAGSPEPDPWARVELPAAFTPPAPPKPPPASTPPQVAPPVVQAPPPARWRLADATGQQWEHGDRAYLEAFVSARNAALYAPVYSYRLAPSCAAGSCPR